MNWLHASFGLGALLGPALMTAILSSDHSWRWGYVVAASLQVALTAGFVLTRHSWDTGTVANRDDTAAADVGPVTGWLVRALLWLGMGLFFVSAGLEATTGQWSFTLFTEGRGAPVAVAGFWVSAYWLAFTLTRIAFGFVADRVAATAVLRAGVMATAGATLLLTLDVADGLHYLSLVLMGIALAPMAPLLTSTTAARVGAAQAVRGVGFQVGAAGVGIALVPALAGVLAERLSIETLGPYLLALCVILGVLLEVTNALVKRRMSA
jgi:fucose permease